MSLAKDAAVLRRLSSSMHSLARRVSQYAVPRDTQIACSSNFTLPFPEPLEPKLRRLGLDQYAANLVSSAVLRFALKLKGELEGGFRRNHEVLQARHCLDTKASQRLATAYTKMYSKAIRQWSTHVLENFAPALIKARALYRRENTSSTSLSTKRPFNQNAVPILERFFNTNAFPSRLEKYELASKCDMEYRQIHVWFQNRRSRYRKDGKDIPAPRPLNPLVEELEKTVVNALLPDDRSDTGSEDDESNPCRELCPDGPAHAFPAPYPPLCSYDPFPTTPEKRALHTPWMRSSNSKEKPRIHEVDVVDLTLNFAKLTISDALASHGSCDSSLLVDRDRTCSRSYPGLTTQCPRAPLPSLIDFAYKRLARRLHIDGSFGASHEGPICITSPARPKRTLPRRMPKFPPSSPTPHALNLSMIITAPSPTDRARTPSLTPSSRSASFDSDRESPLSTPTPTGIALPLLPIDGTYLSTGKPTALNDADATIPHYFDWTCPSAVASEFDHWADNILAPAPIST